MSNGQQEGCLTRFRTICVAALSVAFALGAGQAADVIAASGTPTQSVPAPPAQAQYYGAYYPSSY